MTTETRQEWVGLVHALEASRDELGQSASRARTLGLWIMAHSLEDTRRQVLLALELVRTITTVGGIDVSATSEDVRQGADHDAGRVDRDAAGEVGEPGGTPG